MDYKKDLATKLVDLKKIEGFPLGKDEDVIALSHPPFYTACPNPYINEFIKDNGKPYDEKSDAYRKTPFTDDIDTNKNDKLTNAHSYHTKSPWHAIKQYIEHYTQPGDIVLDCFTGSGMTGIAAQKAKRKAVLLDLSPIASFISYNYNVSISKDRFLETGGNILDEIREELGWMLKTKHTNNDFGRISSILFSEHFLCPICNIDYQLWDFAVDNDNRKLKDVYECKSCGASISKNESKKSIISKFDKYLDKEIASVKISPVEITYNYLNKTFRKCPDNYDLELINKIETIDIDDWFPTTPFMGKGEKWGDTWRSGVHLGMTHVHHFYTKRNLIFLSKLFHKINLVEEEGLKSKLLITFNSFLLRASKKAILAVGNYFNGGGGYITTISGNMYIPSLFFEVEVTEQFENRLKKINEINIQNFSENNIRISCQSATDFSNIPDNSIDYIFVDPPFGENLMYSELNFLYEAWFKVTTNNKEEAIMNKSQNKVLSDYNLLMQSCFKNLFRILKPNRWITIEYHNSKSAIWNGLQESLTKAGFVIAHTSILKNKGGSFTINVSPNSVSNDLIINAYKPSHEFMNKFITQAGENVELEFVNMFLQSLPIQPMIERTEKMLYSKMIAYYLQKAYQINYDAKSFYEMLFQNFIEQDGFWFTSNQINSYTEFKKKVKIDGLDKENQNNMMLFIVDEKSSILWLQNFLSEPQNFSDISTAYNKISNISGDLVPDLKVLLDENFVFDDKCYKIPTANNEHLNVIDKRNRTLKKEFETILIEAQNNKSKIKIVRKEALFFGFELCYKTKRFEDILTIAKKLDKSILENNSELSDFVEAAGIMIEGIS